MNYDTCIYCGDIKQCRDHVVPLSWLRERRDYRAAEIVPCCNSCNLLAGSYVPSTIEDKANFILSKILRKYNRYLKPIRWTEEEIGELDHSMATYVSHKVFMHRLTQFRVANLRTFECGGNAIPISIERRNYGHSVTLGDK